ncbi:MAG: hypothetical protein XD95_0650, partial [Microgenomates bacterium 39_7]
MLKKKIFISLGFLFTAFLIILFALWQIHKKTELPPLINNEGYLIPSVSFEIDHSELSISTTDTTQEATKIIFNLARYGRSWEYFHLPQTSKQALSLQPSSLVFEIKHLDKYSQSVHGSLFDVALDENNNPSTGFICNENNNLDTIHCQLFVGDWLFEKSEDDIEFYLTNRIFKIILVLGRQDLSHDQYNKTLEELHRQLQEQNLRFIQVSQNQQLSLSNFLTFPQLIEFFQPTKVRAQLTEYCAGDVRCYLWVKQCRCPSGITCRPGEPCSPEDGGGICPDCDEVCSSSYDNDHGQYCRDRSLGKCAGPVYSGTCEGMSPSTYCATGGTCFPSGGGSSPAPTTDPTPPPGSTPTPTPPNGGCGYQCCYDSCYGGPHPEGDEACGDGKVCCESCWSCEGPGGTVKLWFFYDQNTNGIFDVE